MAQTEGLRLDAFPMVSTGNGTKPPTRVHHTVRAQRLAEEAFELAPGAGSNETDSPWSSSPEAFTQINYSDDLGVAILPRGHLPPGPHLEPPDSARVAAFAALRWEVAISVGRGRYKAEPPSQGVRPGAVEAGVTHLPPSGSERTDPALRCPRRMRRTRSQEATTKSTSWPEL